MLDDINAPAPEAVEEGGGHPLFPRQATETGPDRRKFDLIQVIRYLKDGSREICPKTFKGTELRSWQQILDEYGGDCYYQLVSQCGRTHQYSAWSEKYFFSAPARKSFQTGATETAAQQQVQQQQTVPSMHNNILEMLLQIALVFAKAHFERPQVPTTNPLELMREAFALANTTNRSPNSLELLKEVLPLINAGDRGSQQFKQGLDLGRELAGSAGRSSSDDLGDMMSLAKLFTAFQPAASAPPPAQPAPQAAPPRPTQSPTFAPPFAPAPGYGWMFTQQGWIMFPLAMAMQSAPIANSMPAPAAPPGIDEDALLRTMLAKPEIRAKLQSILTANAHAPTAPVPTPRAAVDTITPPAPAPTSPRVVSVPATPVSSTSDVLAAPGNEAADFTMPEGVSLPPELAEILGDPGFRQIAQSVVPQEHQGAFAQMISQNIERLKQAEK